MHREEGGIARYLVVECSQRNAEENDLFEKILQILDDSDDFTKYEIEKNPVISVAGIEINTRGRRVYCNQS